MKYEKPPLTFEAQAALLIHRGMVGDLELIMRRLASVNYYRLSGYWYPFRKPNEDSFWSGTAMDTVWLRYTFDRRLRLVVMDAIERIEVAVRSQLAYHHALLYGPFAYADDAAAFPKFNAVQHSDFVQRVAEETERSRERFVEHFRGKYGDTHDHVPVWMAIEVMSFGTVLTFFRGSSHKVKQDVASVFGVPDVVFDSWLLALNTVRNICAHHGRLWNRESGTKPIIPAIYKYPDWHTPVKITNSRLFAILTICRHCLRCVAPQSRWVERLRALLVEYSAIPIKEMGFPANWKDSPLWKEDSHGG